MKGKDNSERKLFLQKKERLDKEGYASMNPPYFLFSEQGAALLERIYNRGVRTCRVLMGDGPGAEVRDGVVFSAGTSVFTAYACSGFIDRPLLTMWRFGDSTEEPFHLHDVVEDITGHVEAAQATIRLHLMGRDGESEGFIDRELLYGFTAPDLPETAGR